MMSAMSVKTKRPLNQLTTNDLKEVVQAAVHEALRAEIASVHVDSRGYIIFPNEEEYAAYLKTQPDKLPSEIKASFIDPQGLRVHYSDYEPTPKKARELDAARRGPTVPDAIVRAELRKLGVKV